MADKKAEGPQGAGEDLTDAVEPAPASVETPEDGYIPPEDDEAAVKVSTLFESEKIASFDSSEPEQPAEAEEAVKAEEAVVTEEAVEADLVDTESAADVPVEDESVEDEAEAADGDGSVLAMFRGEPDFDEDQLEQAEAELAEAEREEQLAAKPGRPAKKIKSATAEADESDTADSPAQTTRSNAPVKKNRPTRTRAEATQSDAPKKTGLGDFLSQIVQELKKVSWPTGPQLVRYFVVVLVFVLFMIAFIGLLDLFFGWLMLKLFG